MWREVGFLGGLFGLAGLAALVSCTSDPGDDLAVYTVKRCGSPLPAQSLPELQTDPRYQAFFGAHPIAQVAKGTGDVLANARIVAVFFDDDPLREKTELFLRSYGCTSYFRDAVNEYGVGDTTYDRSVVLSSDLLDSSVLQSGESFQRFITDTAASGALGAMGKDDVPIFFFPKQVGVYTADCSTAGGYHAAAPIDGTPRAFAVINDCTGSGETLGALDLRTYTLSHELIELTTDPIPGPDGGWEGLG
jgi:hypothetical protein